MMLLITDCEFTLAILEIPLECMLVFNTVRN